MSDCCSTSCDTAAPPKKYLCPANGKAYHAVSSTTILHHIKEPWGWNHREQGYYFCDDPQCEIAYFGEDNSVIKKSALRTIVGIKENSSSRLICYCFGITMDQAEGNSEMKEFVIRETKEHTCACDIRNPSGRCCLKDFSKT